MRRTPISIVVVLLLILAVAGVLVLLGGEGGPTSPTRPEDDRRVKAPETAPGLPPPPLPGPEEPVKDPGPEPVRPVAPGVVPVVEGPDPDAALTPTVEGDATEEEKASSAPAIRPNPRTPPAPRPGVRPVGGGRGNMGPTGLWERFPPEIPRGKAAIEVTVLDRRGEPVEGADVYIGPPERAGRSAVSFGDLRKIGKTGPAGKALGERLPEGSISVAANVGGLLNGPRGLDMTGAGKTVLVADKTVAAEVRLPLDLSKLGSIRGRVVRPDGKPVRSVSVMVGFSHDRTKKNGRFELPFVPVGRQTLNASRYGFTPRSVEVLVEAGKVVEVEIEVDHAEKGTLALSGTVVGPEGEPVGGALVYVIAKHGRGAGTVRSGEADDHGRFAFGSLPDRLAKAEVRIQANRSGYRSGNLLLPEGLGTSEVEVRLPMRLVKLRLTVTDAATGAPLTRCRLQATKEGRRVAGFSSRSEDGRYETWLEPGEHDLVIEAPGHETQRVTVDVGTGGGEYEHAAKLVAEGADSREVILTVVVSDEASGAAVETARVVALPEGDGPPLAQLEGVRPGGRFVLPVPSGRVRVRVSSEGYETFETALDLGPEDAVAEIAVRLRPR